MLLAHALSKIVARSAHPAFGFREAKTLLALYAHPALGAVEAAFLTHAALLEQRQALSRLCALGLACKREHRFALHPRYLDGVNALVERAEQSRAAPVRAALPRANRAR